MSEDENKKKKIQEHLGYIGLGVCIDYFIFRPVRKLRPLWFFAAGVVVGMIYSWGLDKIVSAVKGVLS